jgi:hypothetical protein
VSSGEGTFDLKLDVVCAWCEWEDADKDVLAERISADTITVGWECSNCLRWNVQARERSDVDG